MTKVATKNARIEPELKNKAELIFRRIRSTAAEAIRLFYEQIYLHHGLPFDVKIPNKTTLKAMRDAQTGKTHKARSVDALFDDLQ